MIRSLTIIFSLLTTSVIAQQGVNLDEVDTTTTITENNFVYPAGEQAFHQFLQDHIKLDAAELEAAKNKSFSFTMYIDSSGVPIKIAASYKSTVSDTLLTVLNSIDHWSRTRVSHKGSGKFMYYENFIWLSIVFDEAGMPTGIIHSPKNKSQN